MTKVREISMPSDVFDQLRIFQDLNPVQRAVVKPLFDSCKFEAGTVIFEQGEVTDSLYLILDGEVQIRYKPDDGPAITVARVRPEGMVGWSAALGRDTYTSAAFCSTDCLMLRVHGADLRLLCEEQPQVASIVLERLATLIAKRLRNTHGHVLTLLKQGLRVNAPSIVAHR